MDESEMSLNHQSAADAEAEALSRVLPAIHEAAHAVVARKLGRGIRFITLRPGKENIDGIHADGMTCYRKTSLGERVMRLERGEAVSVGRGELAREITIACAGMVAEGIFLEKYGAQNGGLPPGIIPPGCAIGDSSTDLALVSRYRRCLKEKDREPFTCKQFQAAEVILNENWSIVRALAEELLKRKTLKGKEAYELIAKAGGIPGLPSGR